MSPSTGPVGRHAEAGSGDLTRVSDATRAPTSAYADALDVLPSPVGADTPVGTRKGAAVRPHPRSAARHAPGSQEAGIPTVAPRVDGAPDEEPTEEDPVGMLRKLVASGVAAKVVQELQKPQNQAKIKKAIRDYQSKNKKGGTSGRAY